MPTVKNVQRQIQRLEGFEVRFLYEGPGPTAGRDVRDDRSGLPGYPYERASYDSTVADWVERRFKCTFPGFDVEVLKGDGSVAGGRTKLSTVRSTYQ
jgi:hypothetical protein